VPILLFVLNLLVGFDKEMGASILKVVQVDFFILFGLLNVCFWYLLYLMRNFHRYEFDKNKKQLLFYYTVFLAVLLVDVFYTFKVEDSGDDELYGL
jgi:hypothetical protein